MGFKFKVAGKRDRAAFGAAVDKLVADFPNRKILVLSTDKIAWGMRSSNLSAVEKLGLLHSCELQVSSELLERVARK